MLSLCFWNEPNGTRYTNTCQINLIVSDGCQFNHIGTRLYLYRNHMNVFLGGLI